MEPFSKKKDLFKYLSLVFIFIQFKSNIAMLGCGFDIERRSSRQHTAQFEQHGAWSQVVQELQGVDVANKESTTHESIQDQIS